MTRPSDAIARALWDDPTGHLLSPAERAFVTPQAARRREGRLRAMVAEFLDPYTGAPRLKALWTHLDGGLLQAAPGVGVLMLQGLLVVESAVVRSRLIEWLSAFWDRSNLPESTIPALERAVRSVDRHALWSLACSSEEGKHFSAPLATRAERTMRTDRSPRVRNVLTQTVTGWHPGPPGAVLTLLAERLTVDRSPEVRLAALERLGLLLHDGADGSGLPAEVVPSIESAMADGRRAWNLGARALASLASTEATRVLRRTFQPFFNLGAMPPADRRSVFEVVNDRVDDGPTKMDLVLELIPRVPALWAESFPMLEAWCGHRPMLARSLAAFKALSATVPALTPEEQRRAITMLMSLSTNGDLAIQGGMWDLAPMAAHAQCYGMPDYYAWVRTLALRWSPVAQTVLPLLPIRDAMAAFLAHLARGSRTRADEPTCRMAMSFLDRPDPPDDRDFLLALAVAPEPELRDIGLRLAHRMSAAV